MNTLGYVLNERSQKAKSMRSKEQMKLSRKAIFIWYFKKKDYQNKEEIPLYLK